MTHSIICDRTFECAARILKPKADFIAKMSISSKEARESRWWLRILVKAEIVKAQEVNWEQDEIMQIGKMIRSAILTARSSSTRGSSRG